MRQIRVPALVAGGFVGATGVALGYLTFARPQRAFGQPTPADRLAAFSRNAAHYDNDVGTSETISGISGLRADLLKSCCGNVLELAAGTGRNLTLYPPEAVHSLTLLDLSVPMLAVAEGKLAASNPASKISVRLVAADASSLPFEDNVYDTVVDTFGLCSVDDPAGAIREAARVLRPGGQLLLLEHGRSGSSNWVNSLLDRWADAHAHKHGCSWNRDIEGIVRSAAARAGLHVEGVSRHHAGTTVVLRCRRPAALQPGPLTPSGKLQLE